MLCNAWFQWDNDNNNADREVDDEMPKDIICDDEEDVDCDNATKISLFKVSKLECMHANRIMSVKQLSAHIRPSMD